MSKLHVLKDIVEREGILFALLCVIFYPIAYILIQPPEPPKYNFQAPETRCVWVEP